MKQAFFRPLTPDRKVDLSQVAPEGRTLADLLPTAPAGDSPATPPARPVIPARLQFASGVLVAVIAVVLLALALGSRPPAAVPAVVPSAPPAVPSAPTAPSPIPQASAAAVARLERPVAAFAAPDGIYLGIIEAGRAYTLTARLSLAWTQIEAAGSGRVWVAARELAPDPTKPDLATPTLRPVPTSIPAPAAVEQPPAPTQCAVVNGAGITVRRCGVGAIDTIDQTAKAAWYEQFNGHNIIIVTATPRR